jgi:hypothetical protein
VLSTIRSLEPSYEPAEFCSKGPEGLQRDALKAPIAITGMHRTGTSMVTRALHDCGLFLIAESDEELVEAAEDNPEGFWENKAIVACNDDLLEATGGAWDNPPELPPQSVDDPRVADLVDAATAAIAALSAHERWGFKDPRTCLTAAYWLDLCPDLRFVICVRHPLEVALSLKRRNQNSYSLGLRLWERYYATVLEAVPRERRIVTHYDTFFVDPGGEIDRLCEFTGLAPKPPRVRTDLRHHTSGVSLIDAGVHERVRDLYASLCREAGLAPPDEVPADDGRVRRLVLDGAVAARHADQRQAAIDRLQEREENFRSEHAAAERELRERIRDLERQVVAARTEALRRGLDERLTRIENDVRSVGGHTEALQRTLDQRFTTIDAHVQDVAHRTDAFRRDVDRRLSGVDNSLRVLKRMDTVLRDIEPGPIGKAVRRRTRRVERGLMRFVLRPGKRAVGGAKQTAAGQARRGVKKLPEPTQANVRSARRILVRARRDPIPTVKLVQRKAVPKARRAAKDRLPPSAQQPLRQADRVYRRARREAMPMAKRVARRLPPSVRAPLTRVARRTTPVRASSPSITKPQIQRPSAPKGPTYREWKTRYEQMLASAVPSGASWLILAPGSPKDARNALKPSATLFPRTRNGQPLVDDLAHVAHLEALRFEGHRYLVLPEGSRAWFARQAEFRDHVTSNYRTVVDEAGAGAVFDLAEDAETGASSLLGAVTQLTTGLTERPAVLNWTSSDIAHELPGLATFRAPTDESLPYLDHTVDVVVVEQARDVGEARRVASTGVVVVANGASKLTVRAIEANGSRPREKRHVIVWSADVARDEWRARLAELATAAGAELRIAPVDSALADAGADDIVVVLEPFVLPLLGTIERAAEVVASHPDVAHAGRVLRGDGRIESAGGTVFFDRSVALIANASEDVRAPWHEYVRPVCWAPGMVAARGALWQQARPGEGLNGREFVREWCAAVWEIGSQVIYQPSLSAVRVHGSADEPSTPLATSAWQRVLDLRPHRPSELHDGTWRYLLAHDDMQLGGA